MSNKYWQADSFIQSELCKYINFIKYAELHYFLHLETLKNNKGAVRRYEFSVWAMLAMLAILTSQVSGGL